MGKSATQPIDVCIIGAGAAGLMCAIEAGKRGRSVVVVEKAAKVGSKILISGGGRCNFTNLHTTPAAFISHNEHFCKSALSRYTQWDFIQLLESHGLSWQEKTLGQLFCEQKSKAVVTMLVEECKLAEATIELNCAVNQITTLADHNAQERFLINTDQVNYQVQSLVIATGGPSIPRMGSTDFGIQIAKQFGLKSYPFRPALVPFTLPPQQLQGLFKDLAGVAVDPVEVSCNGVRFKEAMLITHRGLSGPTMLQISSYWNKADTIHINLLPNMDVERWLRQKCDDARNTELKNVLGEVLPKRLVQRMSETLFVSKPMKQYIPSELDGIMHTLQDWAVTPSGTEGMRTAEVASGGVDTQELSSKTFESKKVAGLYFIGETIDVTGHLGGYNFQWAWASGWCAGQFV